jgi:hypothetical protein
VFAGGKAQLLKDQDDTEQAQFEVCQEDTELQLWICLTSVDTDDRAQVARHRSFDSLSSPPNTLSHIVRISVDARDIVPSNNVPVLGPIRQFPHAVILLDCCENVLEVQSSLDQNQQLHEPHDSSTLPQRPHPPGLALYRTNPFLFRTSAAVG